MFKGILNSGKETFYFSQDKDEKGNWIEDRYTKKILDEISQINSQSAEWLICELPEEIKFEDKPIYYRNFRIIRKDQSTAQPALINSLTDL